MSLKCLYCVEKKFVSIFQSIDELISTCSSVISRFNNRNEYPECLVTATLPFIGGKKRGATTQGGGQEWKESYIRA